MSDLEEIRHRLSAVEEEVARLREDVADRREDVAATRTLAAMADRDASEVRGALRTYAQLLSALRKTQAEQGRTLAEHGQVLGALVEGQHRHDGVLASHGEILTRHSALLDGLTTAVSSLADGQERQAETLAEILRRLPPP